MKCRNCNKYTWIDIKKNHPTNPNEYVLVTDGEAIWLAHWINDPLNFYGEEELKILGEHLREPHWIFPLRYSCYSGVPEYGPFIDGEDSCYLDKFDVTHYMHLPNPPPR